MAMRLTQGMADLRHKQYLETEVAYQEGGTGGSLNPDWVETLMGIPKGWTDLEADSVHNHYDFPAPPGLQKDWEPPRLTTRKEHRVNRLKACGNGVVPQQAALALRLLLGM